MGNSDSRDIRESLPQKAKKLKRRIDLSTGYNPVDPMIASDVTNQAFAAIRNKKSLREMDLSRFTDKETKRFISQLREMEEKEFPSFEKHKLRNTIEIAARTNRSLREALTYIANVLIEDKDYIIKAFNANEGGARKSE